MVDSNLTPRSTGVYGDADWLEWVDDVEQTIGHDLDGDQTADGYSMDWIYALWKQGLAVDVAVEMIDQSKQAI